MRKFLSSFLVLFGGVLWAAPPTLTAPQEVKGEIGDYIVVRATPAGSNWVRYKPLTPGLKVFPSDLLADKTVTVVSALVPGRYDVLSYTGNTDGGVDAITTVVVGKPTTTPPPGTDPPTPPPTTGPKYHYLLVRPGGVGIPKELEAEITRILALPAWKQLKWGTGGETHTAVDLPFTYLPADAQQRFAGQQMPFMVRAQYVGKQIVLPAEEKALPIPTTDEAVLRLPR